MYVRGLGGYIILKDRYRPFLLGRRLHGLGGGGYWKVSSLGTPRARELRKMSLKRIQLQAKLLGRNPYQQ